MSAERRTFEEKYPKFNPENFRIGDLISYYRNGKWQVGKLIDKPRINDVDKKISIAVDGQKYGIEIGAPPKKIELPRKGNVSLNEKKYSLDPDRFYLNENGDPLLDLDELRLRGKEEEEEEEDVWEPTGRKVLGVDVAILREFNLATGVVKRSDVSEDVRKVVGLKRKELLIRQQELHKKFDEMMTKFGSAEEWPDFEAEEVEKLKENVRKIKLEIETSCLALRREAGRFVGGGDKEKKAVACSKHLEDLEDDALTEKKEAGGGESPKTGKNKVSDAGSLEGVEKAVKDEVAFRFYKEDLVDGDVIKKEVERRRQAEAKELGLKDEGGTDDFPSGRIAGNEEEQRKARVYRKKTAGYLREVLSEWKGKTVEKKVKFDFEKEKNELEDKVIALRRDAEKYHDTKIDNKINALNIFLSPVGITGATVDKFWLHGNLLEKLRLIYMVKN